MSDLIGLVVTLPDTCKSCGTRDATVGEGRGPHRAALRCCGCEIHRGWLGAVTYAFLVEIVDKFGKPDQPIAIKRGDNPGGKSIGLISDHSFRASSLNTAAQTDDRVPPAITEDIGAGSNSDGDEKCPWD